MTKDAGSDIREITEALVEMRRGARRRVRDIRGYGIFWSSLRRPGATFDPKYFVLSAPDAPIEDVRWIGSLAETADLVASGRRPTPGSSPLVVGTDDTGPNRDLVAEMERLASECRERGLGRTAARLEAAAKGVRNDVPVRTPPAAAHEAIPPNP